MSNVRERKPYVSNANTNVSRHDDFVRQASLRTWTNTLGTFGFIGWQQKILVCMCVIFNVDNIVMTMLA